VCPWNISSPLLLPIDGITMTCLFQHQVLNVFMTMTLDTRNGIYENTLVKANGLLLGFGSQRFFQFCGSGSESRSDRIGIIFLPDRNRHPGPADPDPHSDQDPDLNPFQPNVPDKLYFFRNFQYVVKIMKIMTLMTLMRKIKKCKRALL
jgi:hypothetical protein